MLDLSGEQTNTSPTRAESEITALRIVNSSSITQNNILRLIPAERTRLQISPPKKMQSKS